MRVIIGLLKGGVIGGGLGFLFLQLGGLAEQPFMHYLLYGAIGLLVGLIAGRPFWAKRGNWVVPVIRALFGVGVCIGLFALATKAFGDPSIPFASSSWPQLSFKGAEGVTLGELPYALGAAVGIVYGIFVEVDDGKKPDQEGSSSK